MLTNILALAAAIAAAAAEDTQPLGQSGWGTLTFQDEFNDGALKNWGTDLSGWKGTAPGAFDSSLLLVKNSRLQIRSQWKGASLDVQGLDEGCDCGFENIATSMVVSKQQFKRGYFEVRAKAYKSTLLNSIWLQGETSEINLADFITEGSKMGRSSNFHCWASDSEGSDIDEEPQAAPHNANAWTTVGLDWQADTVTFYIDGKVVRTLTKARFSKDHPECMDEPMNMILSTETDEDAGIYTSNFGTKAFVIDHVRHWGARAPTTTAPPPASGLLSKYEAPLAGKQGRYQKSAGTYEELYDVATAAACATMCSSAEHDAKCFAFSHGGTTCTMHSEIGAGGTFANAVSSFYKKVVLGTKTCDELKGDGFKFGSTKVYPGFEGVCVHAHAPYASCKAMRSSANMVTSAVAADKCAAIGARLCTSQELQGNVFKNVGCNFAQRRHHHTADQGTCYGGLGVVLSFGQHNPKKSDQCVWNERKAHFRCCGGPIAAPTNTGQAATQPKAVAGAAPMQQDSAEQESGGQQGGDTDSLAGPLVGMASVLVIVGVAAGVALNHRQNQAIAALGLGKGGGDAEAGGRRVSFDDCIDAVSQQGSIGDTSLNASTDGLLDDTPAPAFAPAGTEDPADFDENGFVLTDEGSSLRIKSVRRGNPAYLTSVYVESEAVGDATIEQDSSM